MLRDKTFWILIPLLILSVALCFGIHIVVKNDTENQGNRESVAVYTPQGEVTDTYSTYEEYTEDSLADYVSLDDTVIGSNTTPDGTAKGSYFGNKNSKIYHKSSCSAAKNTKEENKVYFSSVSEYTNKGYSPCKSCKP